jgi:hypothetical protein
LFRTTRYNYNRQNGTQELLMRPDSPLRIAALVAIAILINVWTGGQTHAGCGDYVTIRTTGSAGMTGHSKLNPAETPQPCRGPHCKAQRLPESPPMVPPATVIAPASDLALGAVIDVDTDRQRIHRLPDSSDQSPVHRPSVPFHPPRFTFSID